MNKKAKVLSPKEILLRGKACPDREHYIKSLNGSVKLSNVSFMRLCELRSEHTESGQYAIALVAECLCMSFDEVFELQNNGLVFSEIFSAVNAYLGGDLSDGAIKN